VSEETIDGKTETLRVRIPGKDHPELTALLTRTNKLGRYPHQFPVTFGTLPPLEPSMKLPSLKASMK